MRQLPLDAPILNDLLQVDHVVRERMRARSTAIGVLGEHITGTADTRLLGALTLLVAQLGDYTFERVLHVASTVELIQAAMQVHDDLIDEAARRADSRTLHDPWNQGVPLMVGDYLFALASVEMAEVHYPQVITFFSQAVMRISEGMLTPVMTVTPLEQAEAQYREHIGAVKASLFEAACKAGLAVANGSSEQIEAVGRFGYDLGLAFQIADDVADYTDTDTSTGHHPGADLRRGRITLPLIAAAAAGGNAALAHIADNHGGEEERITWALEQVRLHGVDKALATARRLRDEALAHLAVFPDTIERSALMQVAYALVPNG